MHPLCRCLRNVLQFWSYARKLQQSLNRLGRWGDENSFKFSPTKTMRVHFLPTTETTFKS